MSLKGCNSSIHVDLKHEILVDKICKQNVWSVLGNLIKAL